MLEQRTPRSVAVRPEALAWNEKPSVWVALAIGSLAVSVPWWIDGVGGDKLLGLLAGGGSTLLAALSALHARRCARSGSPV